MRALPVLLILSTTLCLPRAFAEELAQSQELTSASPDVEQKRVLEFEREPAAAKTAPRQPVAAPKPTLGEWPFYRWELGFFAGLATYPYGYSVSSAWTHEYFQSPAARLQGALTRKIFNENWTAAWSIDADFVRTYATQNSSRSSASLTSQFFLIGSALGLRYVPFSWGGFGLRFAVGGVYQVGGSTRLEASGFSTGVNTPGEVGASLRAQASAGLQYRFSRPLQAALEIRSFGEARTVEGGLEYAF